MTEQQPTRFENYPPEPGSTPFGIADPTPKEMLASSPPRPPAEPQRTHSRRGLIGALMALAVSVPIAGAFGANAFSPYPGDADAASDAEPEPEPASEATEFTVEGYTGSVPSGWELAANDDSRAVLAKGANQVSVLTSSPASESPNPVDDIAKAVQKAETGFSGALGDPVNESNGSRALATISGKGTYKGKPAREFAELWLDDDGAYLLIVTVLTAAEGSPIARQATDIAWSLTSGLR